MSTPPRPDHPWKYRLFGSAHVSWKPYAVIAFFVAAWAINTYVLHHGAWPLL
jgi:hypothetical protein